MAAREWQGHAETALWCNATRGSAVDGRGACCRFAKAVVVTHGKADTAHVSADVMYRVKCVRCDIASVDNVRMSLQPSLPPTWHWRLPCSGDKQAQ